MILPTEYLEMKDASSLTKGYKRERRNTAALPHSKQNHKSCFEAVDAAISCQEIVLFI